MSECIVPTAVFGGGGIMYWGCFSGNDVGPLFPSVNGYINAMFMAFSVVPVHGVDHSLRQRVIESNKGITMK